MPSIKTYLTLAGLGIAAIGGFALYRNAGGIADWIESTGRNIGQRLGTIPNILPSFTAGAPINIWDSIFPSGENMRPEDENMRPNPPPAAPPIAPPAGPPVIDPADMRTWPPGYSPPPEQDFLPPSPPEEDMGPVPPVVPNEDPEETLPAPIPNPPNQDPEETESRTLYEAIFEVRPQYESYSNAAQNRLLTNFFRSQGFSSELDRIYERYSNFNTFSDTLQNRLLENYARSIGV